MLNEYIIFLFSQKSDFSGSMEKDSCLIENSIGMMSIFWWSCTALRVYDAPPHAIVFYSVFVGIMSLVIIENLPKILLEYLNIF